MTGSSDARLAFIGRSGGESRPSEKSSRLSDPFLRTPSGCGSEQSAASTSDEQVRKIFGLSPAAGTALRVVAPTASPSSERRRFIDGVRVLAV